jgi:hypothetical protein
VYVRFLVPRVRQGEPAVGSGQWPWAVTFGSRQKAHPQRSRQPRLGYCFDQAVSPWFPTLAWAVIVVAGVCNAGCGRQDQRLQQHQEKLESLGATTAALGDAWLAGGVSGTYTRTALEQTFRLVEQERSTLVSAPATLLDPRGARLSQAAERLSRLLASMMHDVSAADAPGVRRHLADIPIAPPERR